MAAPGALIAYALLGTSRSLVVSATTATSALSAAAVGPLAHGDVARFAALSAALALLDRAGAGRSAGCSRLGRDLRLRLQAGDDRLPVRAGADDHASASCRSCSASTAGSGNFFPRAGRPARASSTRSMSPPRWSASAASRCCSAFAPLRAARCPRRSILLVVAIAVLGAAEPLRARRRRRRPRSRGAARPGLAGRQRDDAVDAAAGGASAS